MPLAAQEASDIDDSREENAEVESAEQEGFSRYLRLESAVGLEGKEAEINGSTARLGVVIPSGSTTLVLELGGDLRSNGAQQSPATSGSAYAYWKATGNSEFYLGYDGFWGSKSRNIPSIHEATLGSVIRLYGGPIDVNSITRLTELHRGLYLRAEYTASWDSALTQPGRRIDASLGWAAMRGAWTINLQLGKSIQLSRSEPDAANLATTVELSCTLSPTMDLVFTANPLLQRGADGTLNSVLTLTLYNRF